MNTNTPDDPRMKVRVAPTLNVLRSGICNALLLDGCRLSESRLQDILAELANANVDEVGLRHLQSALVDPFQPLDTLCMVDLYIPLLTMIGEEIGLPASNKDLPQLWLPEAMTYTRRLADDWFRFTTEVLDEFNRAMKAQFGYSATDVALQQRPGETTAQAETRAHFQRKGLKPIQ